LPQKVPPCLALPSNSTLATLIPLREKKSLVKKKQDFTKNNNKKKFSKKLEKKNINPLTCQSRIYLIHYQHQLGKNNFRLTENYFDRYDQYSIIKMIY
jgi:hypothetical protein